jgi:hypothetical protein
MRELLCCPLKTRPSLCELARAPNNGETDSDQSEADPNTKRGNHRDPKSKRFYLNADEQDCDG